MNIAYSVNYVMALKMNQQFSDEAISLQVYHFGIWKFGEEKYSLEKSDVHSDGFLQYNEGLKIRSLNKNKYRKVII